MIKINSINILIHILFLIVILVLLSLLIKSNSKLNKLNDNFNYTAALDKTLCGCKKLSSNYTIRSKIFNGTEVNGSHDLPWIASFFTFNSTSDFTIDQLIPLCTGTILNSKFILIARHCMATFFESENPLSVSNIFVGAGLSHNLKDILNSERNYRKVNRFYLFPSLDELDKNFKNFSNLTKNLTKEDKKDYKISKIVIPAAKIDLGLMEIFEPFEFSEESNIMPACILMEEKNDFKDDKLYAAGYGDTVYQLSFNESDIDLSKANKKLFITSFKQYKNKFCDNKKGVICVRSHFSSTCGGDSGTPLMLLKDDRLFIVGVLSLSIGNSEVLCGSNITDVYSHVFYHLNWIRSIIKDEMCMIN